MPFPAACSALDSDTFSKTEWRLNSMFSRVSLPASIFEKSRMSLMIPRRDMDELLILVR